MATVTGIHAIEVVNMLYKHCLLTYQHSLRVGDTLFQFARYIGWNHPDQIYILGICHDLGKLDISHSLLNKTSALTQEEFAEIKRHTLYGERWVTRIIDLPLDFSQEVKYHHENWNGTGYYGLKGEEIPLLSRAIRIIDTYDTMLYGRIYQKPKSQLEVIKEIESLSGTIFDKELVQRFIEFLQAKYYLDIVNGA